VHGEGEKKMAITAADIVAWGSAVMPIDDTVLNIGGAIDLTKKIIFNRVGAAAAMEALSSNGGDNTQTLNADFLTPAGVLDSEVHNLNGLAVVNYVKQEGVMLRLTKNADSAGIVTFRKAGAGATIATLEAAVRIVTVPFFNENSDSSTQKTYYDKIFIKNQHGSLSLTSAAVVLQADTQGVISFALDPALNGNSSNGAGNNRQVAPAGYVFNTAQKAIPGNTFTFGSAIGVWLKCLLPIGKTAFDTTFTIRVVGDTAP
jgi:hypothetical protein